MHYQKRAENLVRTISSKVDCGVLTSPPSLRYFFDYEGESFERFCCGLISTRNSKTALIVPKLDQAKAEKSSAQSVFSWTDSEGYESVLSRALSELGVNGKKLGCEDSSTFGFINSFRSVRESSFESISGAISDLRLIKDLDERKALLESAKILREVYRNIDQFVKEGTKESDAASEMKSELRKLGAENADFCAVQSGANSAIPHHETSTRKIRKGDLVVVDISISGPAGYFADYTRTYSIGKPGKLQREVYEIVKKAQADAVEAAKSGVEAGLVDSAARSVIEKSGYGKYFFHRTGHGIGLEVHEAPWIRNGNQMKLLSGMAFTIEPGIYLSGKFGVRIEDNLLVEDSKTVDMTKLGHDLIEL